MTEYKKQHFVPKSYLKKFATPNGKITIISKDKKFVKEVPYTSQNQKNNYYTDDNRKQFEKELSNFENNYNSLRTKIDFETPKESFGTGLEKFILMQSIFSLYARLNPSENVISNKIKGGPIKNFNKRESMKIINILLKILAVGEKLICPEKNININVDDKGRMLYYLILRYGIRIIKSENIKFITSDNPVIFLKNNDGKDMIIVLPISPDSCFIIYDRRKYKPIKTISKNAAQMLNTFQSLCAFNIIYCHPNHSNAFQKNHDNVIKHFSHKKINDNLLEVDIKLSSQLWELLLHKDNTAMEVVPYEEALNALKGKIEINDKEKRITINDAMSLDQMWCFSMAHDIQNHLNREKLNYKNK